MEKINYPCTDCGHRGLLPFLAMSEAGSTTLCKCEKCELAQIHPPVFGLVVFFEILPGKTKKIKEIGRTGVSSYWNALNINAETPNPASQLLKFYDEIGQAEVPHKGST